MEDMLCQLELKAQMSNGRYHKGMKLKICENLDKYEDMFRDVVSCGRLN